MTLRGRRPGDRRVRVERVKAHDFAVAPPHRVRRPPAPALVLVAGFAALVTIGTVLLLLPISTEPGAATDIVTALFTATSAVCVTGLVVVDTATHWSPFGEVVILLLIQVGGFGFMTGSTLLLFLLIGRRTGLRDRILVQASTGGIELGSVVALIRRVAAFTVLAEALGTVVLTAAFLGDGRAVPEALWWGTFHSISAFNNAGFDLTGGFRSLADFATNPVVLATIGTLIVLGGLGFAILGDAIGKRSWARLALETKVVLLGSVVLIAGGSLAIGLLEWSNPDTLGSIPEAHRPLNAVFEAVTLRTAGYAVLDHGALGEATLFVAMALMFIGGASGSTAGGIKLNTFGVLLIAIASTVRGRPSAEAFGRRVSHEVIYRALSVALLAIAFVFVVGFGVVVIAGTPFVDTTFEAISAFATVGLTTGITPDLPDPARLIVAFAMFAGRLGPLTLVLALAARQRPVSYRPAIESMRIG
ncbi:MAG TPA: potassium transporter TrkG [Candidatus Limnocylindrales bacterium]|nr:potassium transporter TrkG [Candidatus Limnocylindrales bacterium]